MMFFSDYVAGVSFTDGIAQIAILEVKKDRVQLRYALEVSHAEQDDLWFIRPLIEGKQKAFRKVKKASIAIDNAQLFLYSFPLDTTLNQVDQNEQIIWEL